MVTAYSLLGWSSTVQLWEFTIDVFFFDKDGSARVILSQQSSPAKGTKRFERKRVTTTDMKEATEAIRWCRAYIQGLIVAFSQALGDVSPEAKEKSECETL